MFTSLLVTSLPVTSLLVTSLLGLSGCDESARISLFDQAPPAPDDDRDAEFDVNDAGVLYLPPPSVIVSEGQEPLEPGPDRTLVGEPVNGPATATTASLLLRYDFEGAGTVVLDRVGGAHGVIRGGAELDSRGGLPLDGVDDYVDMPNHVLSGHPSVTIVAWLEWAGGACWQRIFDFGSNDAGEDASGNATTSLFLTPTSCPNRVLMSMTERASEQYTIAAPSALPVGRMVQVALVVVAHTEQVAIYVDGELQAIGPSPHSMTDLDDVNNWLGRSQWIQDRYLRGRYEELRIYDGALDIRDIAELHARGPDAL